MKHILLLGMLLSGPHIHAQVGSSMFTIPVVVHVLHQNGMENISDAQIYNAIELVNNLYDLTPMPIVEPPFDALVADMEVRLCLATMDPTGEPTTGIERIETPVTEQGGEPESYMNAWPQDRYLNIWVVSTITTGQAAIGTAPGIAIGQPEEDGIMILHNYMGTIGTSSLSTSRALPYAVARYLDLKRMHEIPVDGGPCGDDEVPDTPMCRAYNTCGLTENACDTVRFMEENIMSTSYCSNMFTIGQRDRVHACLTSPVAGRSNLSSATNLASTGCGPSVGLPPLPAMATARMHPMPFHDHLVITVEEAVPEFIQLHDLQGRCLRTWLPPALGEPTILTGLDDLAPGTYHVVLRVQGRSASRTVTKM